MYNFFDQLEDLNLTAEWNRLVNLAENNGYNLYGFDPISVDIRPRRKFTPDISIQVPYNRFQDYDYDYKITTISWGSLEPDLIVNGVIPGYVSAVDVVDAISDFMKVFLSRNGK